MDLIEQEEVIRLFSYDRLTGIVSWKISPSPSVKAGSRAGTTSRYGYRVVKISKKSFSEHRIIFTIMGIDPSGLEVDHINGKKDDNRFINLRLVDRTGNQQNKIFPCSNNNSGFLGVHWRKRDKRFVASIHVKRRTIHLGYFNKAEDAYEAYLKAKRLLHPSCTI